MARLMGVHVRTIDRMVRDGMPTESWVFERVVFCRAARSPGLALGSVATMKGDRPHEPVEAG